MTSYIHADSDIPIKLSCYLPDSKVPPRMTQDTQVNAQGKYLIDLCISSGMRIVNGRHNGDTEGRYTPRGCIVVDYVVVSAELYDRVIEFSVGELPTYTGHCPLHLAVNLSTNKVGNSDKQHVHAPLYPLVKCTGMNSLVCSSIRL